MSIYMSAMDDSKHQMSPEDASINYMFQVCLLAFMRNADQPNFHESMSLFDSLAVRTPRVRPDSERFIPGSKIVPNKYLTDVCTALRGSSGSEPEFAIRLPVAELHEWR
jgi:hypothetical protein